MGFEPMNRGFAVPGLTFAKVRRMSHPARTGHLFTRDVRRGAPRLLPRLLPRSLPATHPTCHPTIRAPLGAAP
jgi:hypothetical protein